MISLDKRLIVALDVPTSEDAKALVQQLEPDVRHFKVGLQLFLAAGFEIIDWLTGRGHEVMLDLKFFDIPATVAQAVTQVRDRGVNLVTVHGNDSILRAAAEAKGNAKILGVTVLTSLDQGDVEDLGFACNIEDIVLSRARRALELGCDGVVSSGLEAPRLRAHLDNKLLIVMPGVRPLTNRPDDDQKRVVTPSVAFQNGASYIVVGRPVRNAASPGDAARAILAEISFSLPS
ncbi:MAG TPA: orotidine-5'-phosphate decarboxylase [Lentisphaeria bacterium]|nr:orotidine-5'-phosphate decarboxylase [Lentisphaeria bacterium]